MGDIFGDFCSPPTKSPPACRLVYSWTLPNFLCNVRMSCMLLSDTYVTDLNWGESTSLIHKSWIGVDKLLGSLRSFPQGTLFQKVENFSFFINFQKKKSSEAVIASCIGCFLNRMFSKCWSGRMSICQNVLLLIRLFSLFEK